MAKRQEPLLLENGKLNIKSPIFTPRPGWGGKLRSWLKRTLGLRPVQFWALAMWILAFFLWVS